MTPSSFRSKSPSHRSHVPPTLRPALSLVPRTTRPVRHTPIALWHLLSLDAPSVATVWTLAVAQTVGLHLPWTAPASMFLAVWILYAADRLLDARALDGHSHESKLPPDLEARHLFHHRHRRKFLLGIVVASVTLTLLLRHADARAMRLYDLLATLLCAYLLIIHARPDTAHRLPKELAVGIFFPAAVFIPTVARLPHLRLKLLPVALLLAAICSLNCLFLYAWEHPAPRTRAHWSTRWATHRLVPLTCCVAALSAIGCLLAPSLISLQACALASALLLLLLHHLRERPRRIHLRALADLVLLTPLVILALQR